MEKFLNGNVKIFIYMFIFFSVILVYPIDMKNNFLYCNVEDISGRFYLKTVKGDVKNPYDDDIYLLYYQFLKPYTSYITVKIGNKVYRLGEDRITKFKRPIRLGNEIMVEYTVEDIIVAITYRFIKGVTTGQADSFEIDIKLINNSTNEKTVSIRTLLDTYLAKNDGVPFRVPYEGEIVREKQYSGDTVPDYIYSFDDFETPTVNVLCPIKMFKLKPDIIILSNWERLYENPWDYDYDDTRRFKSWLFGKIDSALAFYWKDIKIKSYSEKNLNVIYGLYGGEKIKTGIFTAFLNGPLFIKPYTKSLITIKLVTQLKLLDNLRYHIQLVANSDSVTFEQISDYTDFWMTINENNVKKPITFSWYVKINDMDIDEYWYGVRISAYTENIYKKVLLKREIFTY